MKQTGGNDKKITVLSRYGIILIKQKTKYGGIIA